MLGLDLLTPTLLVLCFAVALFAGLVKGLVGFAMPMVMISGLGSFLPPEIAIAALLAPTLVSNALQAFRQGGAAAWQSLLHHKRYLFIAGTVLVLSAQLVGWLDTRVLLALIGVPIVLFGLSQLVGWVLILSEQQRGSAEVGFGVVSGFFGGLSGVWGPPMVMYLTALGTPKKEQMRVQGVAFGLGGALLLVAHLQSGVLNHTTWPLSVALVVPAVVGTWLGLQIQDRIDQALFRKLTLVVLIIAGLNLVRRAVFG
ncbi:MAG: sulfite exporter TauE/SafE family protein [Pseudomonadota bacterium]